MAATNKVPAYKGFNGRTAPILVHLPVQAGSTQAIKSGEICKIVDPTDYGSNPIIPATTDDTDFIPVIAWEEQKSTDAARLMQFALPAEGDYFEFDLNSASAVKLAATLAIHDSQTVKAASSNVVGHVWVQPVKADGTFQSVSKVFVGFHRATANAVKYFPFLGAAIAQQDESLGDLSDVGTVAYDAGKLLVADGTDFDAKAVSGDIALAASGAATIQANAVESSMLANTAAGATPGVPVVFTQDVAGTADNTNICDANCPFKLTIIDAWVVITTAGSSATTIKLTDGTNDITDAMDIYNGGAIGDKAIVRAGEIDDAYATLSEDDSLVATISDTTDSPACTVYVMAIPVA